MMRISFTSCTAIIALTLMLSGCYSGGKWTMPWQSSSPFSSSNTPSSSNVAGATKPSTLATNTPPGSVTAPTVTFPTYPATSGMTAGNTPAPSYPTNPPAGTTAPAYTASTNSAASRTGAYAAPQQGAYPTNNPTIPTATSASAPYNTSSTPYGATTPANSYNTYGASTGGTYGDPGGSNYNAPSNTYGAPPSGSGTMQPASPYGSVPSGAQPTASNYAQSTTNANAIPTNPTIPPATPMTGTYDAGGWSTPPANTARTTSQPATGERYAAANDRYGMNGGNSYDASASATTTGATDPRYGITPTAATSDSRYGSNPPASTTDSRYGAPTDNRYGDYYGNGEATPATTPNNSYPPANNGTGTSVPTGRTTIGVSGSSGTYLPGSVSSYEPSNPPSALTAANSTGSTTR